MPLLQARQVFRLREFVSDSTSSFAGGAAGLGTNSLDAIGQPIGQYVNSAIGLHFYSACERASTAVNQTFEGVNSTAQVFRIWSFRGTFRSWRHSLFALLIFSTSAFAQNAGDFLTALQISPSVVTACPTIIGSINRQSDGLHDVAWPIRVYAERQLFGCRCNCRQQSCSNADQCADSIYGDAVFECLIRN